MQFLEAFEKLLDPKHEGGYSNNPHDKGGETMYGVTEAVARENGYKGEMADLPLEFAAKVYKTKYWDKAQCDSFPDALRFAIFDCAVNSGPARAIKLLQEVVGVYPDGFVGPHTLGAVAAFPPVRLAIAFNLRRLLYWADLADFNHFGKGWVRRGVSNIQDLLPEVK